MIFNTIQANICASAGSPAPQLKPAHPCHAWAWPQPNPRRQPSPSAPALIHFAILSTKTAPKRPPGHRGTGRLFFSCRRRRCPHHQRNHHHLPPIPPPPNASKKKPKNMPSIHPLVTLPRVRNCALFAVGAGGPLIGFIKPDLGKFMTLLVPLLAGAVQLM